MLNVWNTYGGDPLLIHEFYVQRAKNAIRRPYNPNAICWHDDGMYCRWELLRNVREHYQCVKLLRKSAETDSVLYEKYAHLFTQYSL